MKYLLLITLFAFGGCGRKEMEYPEYPTNGWYTVRYEGCRKAV